MQTGEGRGSAQAHAAADTGGPGGRSRAAAGRGETLP